LVLEVVYVDVLAKRLVDVVPKGAFAPLFRGEKTDVPGMSDTVWR